MLKRMLCSAALLVATNICSAGIITQNFSVPIQSTEITKSFTFQLFDTDSGTRILESVWFSLDGKVKGTAEVENMNASPSVVMANLSANTSISTAFSGTLISIAPSDSQTLTIGSFDGTLDYIGPSGVKLVNLNDSQLKQLLLTDSASLLAYTGAGTSTIDFSAEASSSTSGSGNISSRYETMASGDITLIYNFKDFIPPVGVSEPTSFVLLGMGLLAFVRFKRKAL